MVMCRVVSSEGSFDWSKLELVDEDGSPEFGDWKLPSEVRREDVRWSNSHAAAKSWKIICCRILFPKISRSGRRTYQVVLHSKRIHPPQTYRELLSYFRLGSTYPGRPLESVLITLWAAPGKLGKWQDEGSQPPPSFLIGIVTRWVWYIRRAPAKLEDDNLAILLTKSYSWHKLGRWLSAVSCFNGIWGRPNSNYWLFPCTANVLAFVDNESWYCFIWNRHARPLKVFSSVYEQEIGPKETGPTYWWLFCYVPSIVLFNLCEDSKCENVEIGCFAFSSCSSCFLAQAGCCVTFS